MRRKLILQVFVIVLALLIVVQPVLSQTGGGGGNGIGSGGDSNASSGTEPESGGGIVDAFKNAILGAVESLFKPLLGLVEDAVNSIVDIVVSSPHPDKVFKKPTNAPWPNLHDYYWSFVMPAALTLWALSIAVIIFLEATSHMFSTYHKGKLKRRAFTGLLGILSWWWIAALSLRLIDGVAKYFAPTLNDPSLFESVSMLSVGAIGIVLASIVETPIIIAIGLIYGIRQVFLFLYVLMMPVLIALWVPGVGPFAISSRLMKKLATFYVPFLFMTVPVALVFRLGELLGKSFQLSLSGFAGWIMGLITPILAIIIPILMIWQAGMIFFVGDRISSRMSARSARGKRRYVREGSGNVKKGMVKTKNGGGNLVRGVRDKPVVESGQARLGHAGSRTHKDGSKIRSQFDKLRGRITTVSNRGTDESTGRADVSDGGSGSSDGGRVESSGDGFRFGYTTGNVNTLDEWEAQKDSFDLRDSDR